MIEIIAIIGIVISIIGMINRIKYAGIALIMWCLFLLYIYLGLSALRGSLILFLLSQATFLVKWLWIIMVNKKAKGRKQNG